jgi:tRNA threonylcarbamoyl adenosine modification protein (Sua5/YciO/YrdC/YwlC family)
VNLVPLADPPQPEAVELATRALAAGRIVALPTDTVYGLAADPFAAGSGDRLFAVKRRPRHVEVPVLVADEGQAFALASPASPAARILMRRFWPGALTIVLPRRADVALHLGVHAGTVGLRCPAHPAPLALCASFGPLATTSANLHGQPTLTTADAVVAAFGDQVAVVLDGGPCVGSPSTVVDCTTPEPRLLREGRLPWDDVVEALAGRRAT